MKTLVVVPTYQEAENIEKLLDEVLAQGPDVLVVDDGSPDGTAELVKSHPEFGKRVFIIERPRKMGLGSAYVQGFSWALERGYEAIFEMDADFSHDPKDIPRFLQELERGYDLVIGSRYISGSRVVNWPIRRLLLSYFANLYARLLTGVPIKDLTGGYKCYRAKVLTAISLATLRSEGYAFQIETNFRAHRLGFRISEIPIVFTERREGASKMNQGIIWEAFWLVIRLFIKRIFRKKI